jgi:hypothetical protein
MSMLRVRGSRGCKTVGAALLIFVVSGGVAQAASVSTTGSYAWNSGLHLAVKDTLADGRNAYANWNSSSNNRVQTSGGNGSTNDVSLSSLSNFRACRDVSGAPDNCSSWVSP